MRNFLKFSLGIVLGYLVSGTVAHLLLTYLQERAELFGEDVWPDVNWPVPHPQAGCHCGKCLCWGEPLPEEQTLIGEKIRICSVCAQIVMTGPVASPRGS